MIFTDSAEYSYRSIWLYSENNPIIIENKLKQTRLQGDKKSFHSSTLRLKIN